MQFRCWFVGGSLGCLGVLPSVRPSYTGSFGLRELLRALSGVFSGLLGLLRLLGVPRLSLLVLASGGRVVVSPGSSGSCLDFHHRFCMSWHGVFSLVSFPLPSVIPFTPCGLFLRLEVSPYGVGYCSFLLLHSCCMGSVSSFFPGFSRSFCVSLRSSLGQSSFTTSSFPLGSPPWLLVRHSIVLSALSVSPASLSIGWSLLGLLGACFLSVSCLLGSRAVFFPSLGGLCSWLTFPFHSCSLGSMVPLPLFIGWFSFSSPRSNLWFPPRRSPPFGPSQFPWVLTVLFQCVCPLHAWGRLCVGPLLLLSFSSSCLGPLFRWVFYAWVPCSSSSVVLLSGLRSWCLIFLWSSLAGVALVRLFYSLLGLRFLPPVPHGCCFPWLAVAYLLAVLAFPAFLAICLSLASVSFDLVVYSGASLLCLCPCPCLWVPSVRPPRSLLLVLLRLQPCVVLVHLRNSVESQFLRDGVLPLGRVLSYGCFLALVDLGRSSYSRSGRGFSSSSPSAHGWAVFPQLRFAPLRFLSSSLFLGLSAFPYGLTFFLGILCCQLSPLRVVRTIFSSFCAFIFP